MYGKKKFRPVANAVEKAASNIPTYICGKCKIVKAINVPFSEVSIVEKEKPVFYHKLCGTCGDLLRAWVKG
jgi:ribosomal protein S27AE